MTPEEAKQKWCPMSQNKPEPTGHMMVTRCIASDCMAWRETRHRHAEDAPNLSGADDDGYCGLAGKP